MKIKFLGTGASEGIPDLFCRCAVCEKARLHKGRENRTRAGLMVDDDLLIDFSPDFFSNSIKFGIDGNKIETLLITDSQSDHLYFDDIVYSMLSSKNRKKIDIYSNEIVIDRLKKEIDSANLGENFGLHCVESYRTFHVGRRKITAFNAVHMPDERALLYFIEDGNRGYLHLYDTGEVKNEIAEWMQKNGKSGGYSGNRLHLRYDRGKVFRTYESETGGGGVRKVEETRNYQRRRKNFRYAFLPLGRHTRGTLQSCRRHGYYNRLRRAGGCCEIKRRTLKTHRRVFLKNYRAR